MLKESRLFKHFAFSGNFNTHHGLFGKLKVTFASAYNQINGKSSSHCPPSYKKI
jgi:hypothetical protein